MVSISSPLNVPMKFIAIEFFEIKRRANKSGMKRKKKKILSKAYILKPEKLNMHVLDITLRISQIINKITMSPGKRLLKKQGIISKQREILKVLKNGLKKIRIHFKVGKKWVYPKFSCSPHKKEMPLSRINSGFVAFLHAQYSVPTSQIRSSDMYTRYSSGTVHPHPAR